MKGEDMWESPVNIFEIHEPIIEEINKQTEETIFKAIHRVGVDVNKEELIKAMQYDRNQYQKGYKDGYAKAIDEFAEKLNTDVESFEAEVNGIRADLLTLDYFSEFVFDVAEIMKGEQNG
jgi:flagellar biosynthesis/type III secretory pathway protein FliH